VAAGALAAVLALLFVVPRTESPRAPSGATLALDEIRDVSVVIESERELPEATIRVVVTGGVEIDGFAGQRELSWTTTLEHGPNLLSLPIHATAIGTGRVVAIVEHGGRSREAVVELRIDPVAQRTGGSA
jgi:hypothetical protein